MKKTYIKNLSLISLIMILIHLAGLTYQFVTKAALFAIILKISYILMFVIFLFNLLKRSKYTYLIGILMSCVIIIISGMYMDFLSVLVSILIIYYCYSLKFENFDYNQLKQNFSKEDIKDIKKATKLKNKSVKTRKDKKK